MPERARYRRLDEAEIVRTIAQLRDRIQERFPGSGLGRVSGELLALAGEATECVAYLRRPNWPLRIAACVAIGALFTVLVAVAVTVPVPSQLGGLAEVVQAVEAGINDIIFLGIAVYFLVTVESRIKRRRALNSLHELRSVVHIVDMHQLTKDPEGLFVPHASTDAARPMTPPELGRYLDFCSEMLSLAAKLSALYVQHLNDPVVLAAVSEIETLSGGLSGKIWQKITLLDRGPSSPLRV